MKGMSRRDFLRLSTTATIASVGTVGLGGVLSGCGTDSDGDDATDPSALTGTLNVWIPIAYPEFTEMFSSTGVLGEPFLREYSGVTLNVRDLPGDAYQESLLSAIAGGNPPDGAIIWTTPAVYASRNAVLPITDYWPDVEDTFKAGPLDSCRWRDSIAAVPASTGSFAMFYNRELLETVGVGSRDDFPTTWDELRALSNELTIWQGDELVQAGAFPWHEHQGPLMYVWSGLNGSQFFDPVNLVYTIDSDQNIEMLDYWVSWLDEQYRGDLEALQRAVPEAWGSGAAHGAFLQGRLGTAPNGSWAVSPENIGTVNFDWDIARFPVGPSGSQSLSGFWPNWYVIPTGSEDPELAAEYIKFITTRAFEGWYGVAGDLPATEGAVLDEFPAPLVDAYGAEKLDSVFGLFIELLDHSASMWNSPVEEFATDQIVRAVERVLAKRDTPQNALQEAQRLSQARFDDVIES